MKSKSDYEDAYNLAMSYLMDLMGSDFYESETIREIATIADDKDVLTSLTEK